MPSVVRTGLTLFCTRSTITARVVVAVLLVSSKRIPFVSCYRVVQRKRKPSVGVPFQGRFPCLRRKSNFFSFFLHFFLLSFFRSPRRPADDHRGGAKRQRGGRLRGRAAGASPLPVPCSMFPVACSLSLPMCDVLYTQAYHD